MHAKLQNGFLRSAPKTITLDGKAINNPLPEELEQLGYHTLKGNGVGTQMYNALMALPTEPPEREE